MGGVLLEEIEFSILLRGKCYCLNKYNKDVINYLKVFMDICIC